MRIYMGEVSAFVYVIALIILIAMKVILVSTVSDIAEDKGYEKRTWFHMCFWLGLPAYLIVCAMPDKNLTEEIHLLREMLEKQRSKGNVDVKKQPHSMIYPICKKRITGGRKHLVKYAMRKYSNV